MKTAPKKKSAKKKTVAKKPARAPKAAKRSSKPSPKASAKPAPKSAKRGLSYAKAGVNIAAADSFVSQIAKLAQSTHTAEVVNHASKYAGLIAPNIAGMKRPLLAATCDGVGTKLMVAQMAGDFSGLGQDLVAMSVNDLLPLGAQPLLFLDYIATGKLNPKAMTAVVAGVAQACREVGCALLGGETAEMPGVYAKDDFDLAGFAVGVVDEANLPKPEEMQVGDVVLGLPSNGVHSNGLSLARAALFERKKFKISAKPSELGGETVAQALLKPTALYVNQVLALLANYPVRGAAHITGGGLLGRAQKLAGSFGLHIDPDSYTQPAIFGLIQKSGNVSTLEMAKTFNMGLGFLVILDKDAAKDALPAVSALGFRQVGVVTGQSGKVDLGYAHN